MRPRQIFSLIAILAGVGTLVSLYLLWNHYTTGPTFCKIGGAINCDLVNRGPYGEMMGIPVSGIGVLGYMLLGGVALILLRAPQRQHTLIALLRGAATLGFLFSLYLLYLELFVIFAVCPFCMVSLILITIITTLAWTACPVPSRWSNGSDSGDLSTFDAQTNIVYRSSQGQEIPPKSIGGDRETHHRTITVAFANTALPGTLVVKNLRGVPERPFFFAK